MERLKSFDDFLNEQESKDIGSIDSTKFGANIATKWVSSILGLGNQEIPDDYIEETPEVQTQKPYTGCESSTPYPAKPLKHTNQYYINLFTDGNFNEDVRYQAIIEQLKDKSNKLFIVGLRNRLDKKRVEGDKFIDGLQIIDPSQPDAAPLFFQATTCPSLAYYGSGKKVINKDGVAILQPGAYHYKVGIHREGSKNAHEALRQDGDVKLNRFPIGTTKFDTYHPGNSEITDTAGINIHRSSMERGICVGPWSGGCQVISEGNDFKKFMSTLKGSEINGNKFIYCLVELDTLKKMAQTNQEVASEPDKEGEESIVDSNDKSTTFKILTNDVYNELEEFNTDEDKVIDLINKKIKSSGNMKEFAAFYQKTKGKSLKAHLDTALNGDEMEAINFSKVIS